MLGPRAVALAAQLNKGAGTLAAADRAGARSVWAPDHVRLGLMCAIARRPPARCLRVVRSACGRAPQRPAGCGTQPAASRDTAARTRSSSNIDSCRQPSLTSASRPRSRRSPVRAGTRSRSRRYAATVRAAARHGALAGGARGDRTPPRRSPRRSRCGSARSRRSSAPACSSTIRACARSSAGARFGHWARAEKEIVAAGAEVEDHRVERLERVTKRTCKGIGSGAPGNGSRTGIVGQARVAAQLDFPLVSLSSNPETFRRGRPARRRAFFHSLINQDGQRRLAVLTDLAGDPSAPTIPRVARDAGGRGTQHLTIPSI